MPSQLNSFRSRFRNSNFGMGSVIILACISISACSNISSHENETVPTTPVVLDTGSPKFKISKNSFHDPLDNESSIRQVSTAAVSVGATSTCPVAPSSGDSSAQIQACLDAAHDGETVTLAAGVYYIGKMLHVDHAITLATSEGSGVCRDNSNRACAELKAMSTVLGMDRGFLKIAGAHVTLNRIVVNGNNAARLNSREAAQCRAGNNGQGINIHVDGTQFSFIQSSSIRALCGSGLEVGGLSSGLRIQQSFISANGIHNLQSLWSDGITVADSVNAVVMTNEISDNTDVDLIFGGCKSCQIRDNQILHSNSFSHSSFAGMMMQAWPNATSGNYNDSAIINNRIDCSHFRCGFGLLIGSNSWYVAPAFGGTYRGNHISGAQSGFVINDASGAVEIGANVVDQSGGTFLTSGGAMKLAPYALSPKSVPFIVWADSVKSSGWESQEGTGKIANWWTKDSSGFASDDVTPTSSGSSTPNCSQMVDPATDAQFVLRLYCQLLGREPDAGGFQNWLRQVSAVKNRTKILSTFFMSSESLAHGQIQLNDSQSFVRGMYRLILAREVDASGLATWSDRLKSGDSPQTVLLLFLQNAEPKQLFAL